MNKLACLVVAALACAPATLSAQGFEGVIQQEMKEALPEGVAALAGSDTADAGKVLNAILAKLATDTTHIATMHATVQVKGARMRSDGAMAAQGAPDGYAILDAGKSTVYSVFPSQKTVGFATAAAMAELQKRMPQPAAQAAPPRVDLGEKVINGVKAHGYRLTTPDGIAVIWVDPAMKGTLDVFEALQRKFAGPNLGALQAAVGNLGFPVLQQMLIKAPPMLGAGWLFTQMSVTSTKREAVPEERFTIPADYKQVDLAKRLGEQ